MIFIEILKKRIYFLNFLIITITNLDSKIFNTQYLKNQKIIVEFPFEIS